MAQLSRLPVALEINMRDGSRIGIIHAEPPGWNNGRSWDEALALLTATGAGERSMALNQALYERSRITSGDNRFAQGISQVYVGHSTTQSVLHLGNVSYIDTGCSFSDGMLTIVDLATNESSSCRLNV